MISGMIQERKAWKGEKMKGKLSESEVEDFIGMSRIVVGYAKETIVVPILAHNGNGIA